MRHSLLLCALLMLVACGPRQGEVYSTKPLLTDASAANAPALRPGLWVSVADDCAFDQTRPLGTWPDCAYALVVRRNETLSHPNLSAVLRERFVLGAGYPRIMQVRVLYEKELGEPLYYGLRPLQTEGEIVEFQRWSVSCAPPPPNNPDGSFGKLEKGPSRTKGVRVGNDGRCRITDTDQLQAAILASEAWTTPQRFHWVRASET